MYLGWWVLPFHCFLESGAFDGGGLEDLVFMGGDGGQAQGVGDLAGGHSALYVLFIGKDHQHRLLQLVLLDRKQGALITVLIYQTTCIHYINLLVYVCRH